MSEFSTAEIHTNERLLRSDVTLEECKKIEKVLRKNNISYFEKWKFHTGLFHVISSRKNSKCDIYIHSDSIERAKQALVIICFATVTSPISESVCFSVKIMVYKST